MSARQIVVSVVALGIAAAGGYFAHRPWPLGPVSLAAKATDTSAKDGLAELNQRVGGLERTLVTGQLRLASLETAARPDPASAAAPAAKGEPPPPRPSPEEAREREARTVQHIATLLKTEPRDRSWAPGFEDALRSAVKASSPDSVAPTVETVSCRTSVCRLELSFSTPTAQQAFMQTFPAHRPPMTASRWETSPTDDGSAKTTIDVIREGYPVPDPEQSLN
jgi:hypothetical protein